MLCGPPDNSDDHHKIGSRGAMCLLHVSPWGVTLSLQLSKCVLAQWPLHSIRSYECTARGRFTLETASQSATGHGRFTFSTRANQDTALYDVIDNLVNEQTGLQSLVAARESNANINIETMLTDYAGLESLTVVQSDLRFVGHLKKISRDIYDHLAEHLGTQNAASSSSHDLLSSDYSTSSPPVTSSLPVTRCKVEGGVMAESSPILTSQYLHMGSMMYDGAAMFEMSTSPPQTSSSLVPTSVEETNFNKYADPPRPIHNYVNSTPLESKTSLDSYPYSYAVMPDFSQRITQLTDRTKHQTNTVTVPSNNNRLNQSEQPLQSNQRQQPLQFNQSQQPLQLNQSQLPLQLNQSQQSLQFNQSQQPSQLNQLQQPLQLNQSQLPSQLNHSQQPSQLNQSQQPSPLNQSQQPSQLNQSQPPLQLNQSQQPLQLNQSRQQLQLTIDGNADEAIGLKTSAETSAALKTSGVVMKGINLSSKTKVFTKPAS